MRVPTAVWAPVAKQVSLVTFDGSLAMTPAPEPGWWRGPELAPGTRYWFSLDGAAPLPDPRSLSQPDGVHAPSEAIDVTCLRDDSGWQGREVLGSVFYELHVGTFTPEGTFQAAIEKLDHLVSLGVETVEIMPIATFAGNRGWGYDGVGLFGVHAGYGGPSGLAAFVAAAHRRGLAVVLDVVFNHLGPEGNYLAQFGRYFTDAHHTPWGDAVNLDRAGSAEVREFLITAARQWLVDFGMDGLRLDAVHALHDDSTVHFLAELSQRKQDWEHETGRPLTLIAKSDLNQPAMVCPVGSVPDAMGMDGQWADDVHHALHSFFSGEQQGYYVDFGSAEVLVKALNEVFVHDGNYSTFRQQPWGAPVSQQGELYDGHAFVVFLQNHDQVGNRAAGDRIGQHNADALQAAAAALYLLSAYTPLIFMGEEWGASTPFPYFSELGPELGPQVTEGRKREFVDMDWSGPVPDPQDAQTMAAAKLRWDEREQADHARLLEWYRALVSLRELPEVKDPSIASMQAVVVDADTVALRRGSIMILATRTETTTSMVARTSEILASWGEVRLESDEVTLSGPGVAILRISE